MSIKCLFNPDIICRNTDSCARIHTNKGEPYCKNCEHVPDFDTIYFGEIDYEYALLMAISSFRERHEERVEWSCRSKKLPEWLKNLQDGFGILDIPIKSHYFIMKRTVLGEEEYVIISEPYDINTEELLTLYRYCKDRDLNCHINGRSSHFAGRCIRIEITNNKKEVAE